MWTPSYLFVLSSLNWIFESKLWVPILIFSFSGDSSQSCPYVILAYLASWGFRPRGSTSGRSNLGGCSRITTVLNLGWFLRAFSAAVKMFLHEMTTLYLNTSVLSFGVSLEVSRLDISTVGEERTNSEYSSSS